MSRDPCRIRNVRALTTTTSPGVIRPTLHRCTHQASMDPAKATRATSWIARAFSVYIQLAR